MIKDTRAWKKINAAVANAWSAAEYSIADYWMAKKFILSSLKKRITIVCIFVSPILLCGLLFFNDNSHHEERMRAEQIEKAKEIRNKIDETIKKNIDVAKKAVGSSEDNLKEEEIETRILKFKGESADFLKRFFDDAESKTSIPPKGYDPEKYQKPKTEKPLEENQDGENIRNIFDNSQPGRDVLRPQEC